jgi:hypothetical protein
LTHGAGAGLEPGEVQVWLALLRDATGPVLERCRALLSPQERQRMQRWPRVDTRHRFAVARALLRTMLSRFAPVPPRRWRFAAGPGWKPSPMHTAALCIERPGRPPRSPAGTLRSGTTGA